MREWTAANALRIGDDPLDKPAHFIEVHNERSSPIKWLRVGSFEFFLLFDVPPGGLARLPAGMSRRLLKCARWHGGDYGFSAQGEFQNGRRIDRMPTILGDGPARLVTVVATDTGAWPRGRSDADLAYD